MGGDTFEGVEKLTNEQYVVMTAELLNMLEEICLRVQPYIPLPEKQIHGDIDFLLILKPNLKAKDIVQRLKLQKFLINNNDTINSVYKNKQVDFFILQSDDHFNCARFYKSYSGVGAFLGVFLPSKQIKLTTTGLHALGYEKHIKFQYLITNKVSDILQFYGLDYERFQAGFQTRQQLFLFLSECRFLNEEEFVKHDLKHASKLTKFFCEYLMKKGINEAKKGLKFNDPKEETLNHFGKKNLFEAEFENILKEIKRKRDANDKFNATHVMDRFQITGKEFNKYKKEFRDMFENEENYYQYVQKTEVENIIQDFVLKCNIKEPEKGENPAKEEKKQSDI